MRIKEEYKVREMAGEHIVVMQGRYGVDMTKVIALNETSLWLWNRLQGREFGTDDVRDLLQYHKAGACCNVSIINYFLDGLFNVIVVSECWLPPRIPVPPSTLL